MKGDPVDELFAKALNASGLAVPMKRLNPGSYMFGTKKILAKIINGKLVIRVGGGYLSIDEFLDQYTPAELEKLERKDPIKKFSEKVAVSKLISGKPGRDNSPANGLRSPKKGSTY